MKTEEIIKFGRGAINNRSGKKIADSLGGQTKIVLPVVVKHDHRLDSSGTYHERLYFCPKCGEWIAHYNGVVWSTNSRYGQKFCHNCGYKSNWNCDEDKE